MFTGIVQAMGSVVSRARDAEGVVFRVSAPGFSDALAPGDSVAIDGVCQTVTAVEGDEFEFEAIRTTLGRTTLAEWDRGRPVNLEPALRAGDPLGGHLVQGHVDGVAEVVRIEPSEETVLIDLRLPEAVAELTVALGSLAVDGVSLTVNRLEGDIAQIAIIPYTWSQTTFPRLHAGDRVNVEADLIGKYVVRLLDRRRWETDGGARAERREPGRDTDP